MGPHSFKCGSAGILHTFSGIFPCFNGAALFQVRKFHIQRIPSVKLPCFNGAALFQVRKFEYFKDIVNQNPMLQWGRTLSSAEVSQSLNHHSGRSVASMGPHSFKCGSNLYFHPLWLSTFALQWGRTLSSAEVDSFSANFTPSGKLQWGRTLSSAEVSSTWLSRRWSPAASMGPHSFKCGSRAMRKMPKRLASCFNGAALFQVRKWSGGTKRAGGQCEASMGPHSFKCGSSGLTN